MISLLSLLLFTNAHAGVINGGGGGAYVCRNASGEVAQSRLVDLWEAEHAPFTWPGGAKTIAVDYGMGQAPEALFASAMKKLAKVDPGFAAAITKERAAIWDNKNSLGDDVEITVPADLKNVYFPKGCPTEGMMYYNNSSSQLDVREDIFAKLRSPADVAAAWTHEAIYKLLREHAGHTDSTMTRRLVACLYSPDQQCLGAIEPVVPTDRITFRCVGDHADYTIVPDDKLTSLKQLEDTVAARQEVVFRLILNHVDGLELAYRPVFRASIGPGFSGIGGNGEGPLAAYNVNVYGRANIAFVPSTDTAPVPKGLGVWEGHFSDAGSGIRVDQPKRPLPMPCTLVAPRPY